MSEFVLLGQEDPMSTFCRMVIGTRFEVLPDDVVNHAKKSILYTIAVTIGGSAMEGIPAIVDFVKDRGGKPESMVPFYGGKVPASEAALAIGPMSRAMDLGDLHEEAGHCSEYILPALLAATGLKDKVTGKEFITAFVVGEEILLRIGIAFRTLSKASVMGRYAGHFIFGCVGAVGKLLGLSLNELENAEGIASTMTQPHTKSMYAYPTLMVRIHHGFTCQDAINACLLAKRGITGPRQEVLAGPKGYFGFAKWKTDTDALLKRLGEEWEMLNVTMKLYPAVVFTLTAIEGILDQMKEHDLKAEDIARIEIDEPSFAHKAGHREAKWNPQTEPECQFSLPFTVATAAYDGDVFLNSYTPESRTRKHIRDLMAKISTREDPSLPKFAIRIKTTLKDGKKYSKKCIYAKGHPKNPLTDAELIGKFKKCACHSAYKLNEGVIDSLVNTLLNLEKVDDVVTDLLVPLTPK